MKGEIITYSGRVINVFNPVPEDFNLIDIAQGLANTTRFGGQIENFYSVAEHSVQVALRLPPELHIAGLLHDASEAYIQDLLTPIKYAIPVYRDIEAQLTEAIAKKFDVDFSNPLIKAADNAQFEWEWANIKTGKYIGRLPSAAKQMFLAFYGTYTTEGTLWAIVKETVDIGNSDLA
jgi:uncharacterized protein